MKLYRLIDFYKTPRTYGIFYAMSQNEKFSELFSSLGYSEPNDYHSMDIEYIYNHSGLKTVSTLLEQFLKGYIIDDNGDYVIMNDGKKVTWEYVINLVDQDIINFILSQKFYNKWLELIKTLQTQFDALLPYSMTYERDTDDTLSSTNKNDSSYTNNGSSTDNSDSSGENNNSIYGFNSVSSVPTDENSNKRNIKRDITNTDNGVGSNSTEYSRTNNLHSVITRKGNIGNKSSQELIEEQRKMLQWQLYDVIFNDLDSVLTRSKYIS